MSVELGAILLPLMPAVQKLIFEVQILSHLPNFTNLIMAALCSGCKTRVQFDIEFNVEIYDLFEGNTKTLHDSIWKNKNKI